ncbi:MAG: ABC transporter ATP-binding protein [Myxococcales bacterium]|nr:ABC transporter ATP-binding protein [Myxococcales bacterium]
MAESALCVEHLCVDLSGKRVVDAVSLELAYGEVGVIAGPNGAGKSTLLRALLGITATQAGRIKTAGKDLASFDYTQRAKIQSYVPQTSALNAALSVREIVTQGRFARGESTAKSTAAVGRALERIGIRSLAERNYLELSGGERRLSLIARALCTEARIIFLDEPTSGLDIANRLRILALLQSLASENYAILAVLHELDDVMNHADSVTLLRHGKVAYSGPPKDVVTAGHVREIYGVELAENAALGFSLPSGGAS